MKPETIPRKPPSNQLSFKVPDDIAQLLARLKYETGMDKQDIVLDAIRKVYGEDK